MDKGEGETVSSEDEGLLLERARNDFLEKLIRPAFNSCCRPSKKFINRLAIKWKLVYNV